MEPEELVRKAVPEFEKIASLMEGAGSKLLEVKKLYIGLWDKLVILGAGVLTLSLTAATAFRGHTVGDGGVGYLFLAWKFLMVSIVLAGLAQVVAAIATEYMTEGTLYWIATARFFLLSKAIGIAEESVPDYSQKAEKGASVDKSLSRLSLVLGIAALVMMICALYCICLFGRVNLTHFLAPS